MVTYTLGRDYSDPIAIDDSHSSVSHTHATITVDGDSWVLNDNDSTNGTYVEENGVFRRYKRVSITPQTWIRLGEEGHRGYCFKARRVLKPNNYREDFEEIFAIYREFEETRYKLESNRRTVKFITPVLMCIGLALSFLPPIKDNGMAVRASFMLPGFLSPFIQDLLLRKLELRVRELQDRLICPKCRRPLTKNDIINREHTICHAK